METSFNTGKPIGTCIGKHDFKLGMDAKTHLQKAGVPLLVVQFERRAQRAFMTIDYMQDKDRAINAFKELHPDFSFDYNQGTTLYFKQDPCKNSQEDRDECNRIEEQIQDAMNQLPADQLLTFQWAFSFYFESLEDKSEVPENIAIWLHRAKTALAFRSLQMKVNPQHKL